MLYTLGPVWKSGDFQFPSIDNQARLFDCDDLLKTKSLQESWEKPTLYPSEKSDPIDLYFCVSEHFAFSPKAVEVLKNLTGESVEWLPVEISGIGEYFFINPLVSINLGPDSVFEKNEISKNIVEIKKYDFLASDLVDLAVFRIGQPQDSSAGEAGFCLSSIVVNEPFKSTWSDSSYQGLDFKSLPAR